MTNTEASPGAAARVAPKKRTRRNAWWAPAKFSRWLHTYVSLLGFGFLVFFSITGITLNHASFFEMGEPIEQDIKGTVSVPEQPEGAAMGLGLLGEIRSTFHIDAHLDGWEVEDNLVLLSFRKPGYVAELEVDQGTGAVTGYTIKEGLWTVLNDLHKGRSTGRVWSWVIDISAVVLLIAGATGIWLLWYVKKRRKSGLVLTGAGILVTVALCVFAS